MVSVKEEQKEKQGWNKVREKRNERKGKETREKKNRLPAQEQVKSESRVNVIKLREWIFVFWIQSYIYKYKNRTWRQKGRKEIEGEEKRKIERENEQRVYASLEMREEKKENENQMLIQGTREDTFSLSLSLSPYSFTKRKRRIVRSIWDENESDGKDGKKLFHSEKKEEKRREMIRSKKSLESGNGGNEKRESEINQLGIGTGGDEKKKRKMENKMLHAKLPRLILFLFSYISSPFIKRVNYRRKRQGKKVLKTRKGWITFSRYKSYTSRLVKLSEPSNRSPASSCC